MRPEVQAHNITYPHSLIQLIQGNLFHGLPNEDPYAHLATYIEICNIVKIVGVPEDAIRLSLFSFSLVEGHAPGRNFMGRVVNLQDNPSPWD